MKLSIDVLKILHGESMSQVFDFSCLFSVKNPEALCVGFSIENVIPSNKT